MTADQATADIIHLVYEAAVISPDPYVQETHVETSIRDVLEELLNNQTATEDLELENLQLTRQVEDLQDDISELKSDIEVLQSRLRAAEELDAA